MVLRGTPTGRPRRRPKSKHFIFLGKLGFYGNLVRHHGGRFLYFVLFHDNAQYRHLSRNPLTSRVSGPSGIM